MTELADICLICNVTYVTSFLNILGLQICDNCYEHAIYCIKCKRKIYSEKMKPHIYHEWIQHRLCTICTDNRHVRYICKNVYCMMKNNKKMITKYSELPIYFDYLRSDGSVRLCNICLRKTYVKKNCKSCKMLTVRLKLVCKECKRDILLIERRCFNCYKWIDTNDIELSECIKSENGHVF